MLNTDTVSATDFLRQLLNVLLVPAMILMSVLPQFANVGRTAKEFSDLNPSLLVPSGTAFSIWSVIFFGCFVYALIQAHPKNKRRHIYRQTGWATALGFAMIVVWTYFSSYGPMDFMRWGTALAFVPVVIGFVIAVRRMTLLKSEFSEIEKFFCLGSVALIAGWTTIAMFLNWTPIFTAFADALKINPVTTALVVLGAAAFVTSKLFFVTHSNKTYLFPVIWGLAWLAHAALTKEPVSPYIGFSAIAFGLYLILIGSLDKWRTKNIAKPG